MRTLLTVLTCLFLLPVAAEAQESDTWWTPQRAVEDSTVRAGFGICDTDSPLSDAAVTQLASRGDLWTSIIHPSPDQLQNQTPQERVMPYRRLIRRSSYRCTAVSRPLAVEVVGESGDWAEVELQDDLTLRMLLIRDFGEGMGAPAPPITVQPAARSRQGAPSGWRVVGSWNGSGQVQTRSFSVPSREWRIQWRASPTSDYGSVFQVYVYRADGQLVTVAANAANRGGSQTSYVHDDYGRYYLMVNAANVNWSVQAQVGR